MEDRRNWDGWLDEATGGIRFGPDRRAVRAELEAHLEDKTADLARIFPDMPPEEARDQALEGMGDPAEIGKELAKLHRPWLGYLWQASRWAAWLLAAGFLAVCVLQNDYYQSVGHPLWGEFTTSFGPAQSQRVELGGYTFQITGAAFLDYPKGSVYQDCYQLTVRVSSPWFWERIDPTAMYTCTTAVGPDGQRFPLDRQTVRMEPGEYEQVILGMTEAKWGLFYREFAVYLDLPWQEGAEVGLDFDFSLGSFTLTADDIERVVME